MEAKELRIGNWVYDENNEPAKISLISSEKRDKYEGVCPNEDYELEYDDDDRIFLSTVINPIPLTEEWLVKFGFKEYNLRYSDISSPYGGGEIKYLLLGNRGLYKIHDGFWTLDYVYFNGERPNHISNIKYVHQLQNLYFALTGEELCVKE